MLQPQCAVRLDPLKSAGCTLVGARVNVEPRAGTTAAAPAKLKKGDVVFMMDSYAASYSMAVVGGAK